MLQTVRLPQMQRLAIRVRGQVQGVGFRPYIYRLAEQHELSGWVRNDAEGVLIEVQGEQLDSFVDELNRQCPALARIDELEVHGIPVDETETGFNLAESVQGRSHTLLPPDTAVCDDCLRELFDPASRYYRYPFLNCTHCGPRYTVVNRLPYDRRHTSLAGFSMCPSCVDEYHSVLKRRFHAQPTACPECGPQLSHAIADIIKYLRDGKILAIKGLGGFHLVCDASSEQAVSTLRERKQRNAKPFALMLANIESARALVEVNDSAAGLLQSPQRPVVVLPRRQDTAVSLAGSIAPGLNRLAIMLPYTPLHYLLFHEAAARPNGIAWLNEVQSMVLVMTSANPHGEPLVTGNEEAQQRLANIADVIVSHDRDIVTPVDDSVLESTEKRPRFIRRARGFVPEAIQLPFDVPNILAVGAHLKNTVCVTRGDQAFVSQHIGSLDNPASIDFFEQTIDRLCDFLQVEPEIIAHDLHPDFVSTRYALDSGLKTEVVQHHHAHLAAVMLEHRLEEPAVGLVLDGYGIGDDGSAWGGELMLLNGADYERLGHLKPLAQPGGEQAAREPWRMAASVLHELGRGDEIEKRYSDLPLAKQLVGLLEQKLHCPSTTSAGRLFDAVSGLLKITTHNRYEAEAAMRLQSLVTQTEVMHGGWLFENNQLDLSPLLLQLSDLEPVKGANLFHGTFIAALCDWVVQQAREKSLSTVLLSGGCFLNTILFQGVTGGLQQQGLTVLTSESVPVNDGGLSLGQTWVAALRNKQGVMHKNNIHPLEEV